MTRPWVDLVRNSAPLLALYTSVPPLDSVRLRSIHLDWRGPSLTLRIDLPEFPPNAPSDWLKSGHDTFQCHLEFLPVSDLVMESWTPTEYVNISLTPLADNWISVKISGPNNLASFTSSDSLLVGHMSAFTASADGSDAGARKWFGRMDARRFTSLPDPQERTFYERL